MSIYAVTDPATGDVVAEYPTISDEELRGVISAADAAFRGSLAATEIAERAALIGRVGQLHTERREQLAQIIIREMGKPLQQALGEVDFAASIYNFYAEHGAALLRDEELPLLQGRGSAMVRSSAVGVLLGIAPWNYPYYQIARFAAPNLVVGNAIIHKHAPQCPESAAAVEALFAEAGFPAGSYTNVYASNDQIEWVIGDPRIRGVSLTGSERAGSAVAAIAGRHLKKIVLELGGSDPFLVLDTSSLDRVVDAAVAARLTNSGQACNAGKRFIVLDDVFDEFLGKFTAAMSEVSPGDPRAEDTRVGPLSSAAAADRLADQIRRAVDEGATLVTGGGRDGNFFQPAVLTDISPDNRACREEFFGPVAQVYRARDEAEAVQLANDTQYGLGSYVFSDDREQALRVADEIDAGMVFVNLVGAEAAELPFGGVKLSGFGRELGRYGIDEFVNKKLVRMAD